MRADEGLANLGVVYMEGDLGDMTRLNDIDFLNIEVKYHWKSQGKKCHYHSNLCFNKILIYLTSK